MTKIKLLKGDNMFRIGQKVEVIDISIFSIIIEIGDIGIIKDVDEIYETYEIYFPKKNTVQFCLIYCSKDYLELVHKRRLKRKRR